MGSSHSTTNRIFDKIKSWHYDKAVELANKFFDGDYDFAINDVVLQKLVNFDSDNAKALLYLLGSPNGMMNSMVLLVTSIILTDLNSKYDEKLYDRISLCFTVFDFRRADYISIDELMILILSISSACNSIYGSIELNENKKEKVLEIFRTKIESHRVTKEMFMDWAKEMLSEISIHECSGIFNLLACREGSRITSEFYVQRQRSTAIATTTAAAGVADDNSSYTGDEEFDEESQNSIAGEPIPVMIANTASELKPASIPASESKPASVTVSAAGAQLTTASAPNTLPATTNTPPSASTNTTAPSKTESGIYTAPNTQSLQPSQLNKAPAALPSSPSTAEAKANDKAKSKAADVATAGQGLNTDDNYEDEGYEDEQYEDDGFDADNDSYESSKQKQATKENPGSSPSNRVHTVEQRDLTESEVNAYSSDDESEIEVF